MVTASVGTTTPQRKAPPTMLPKITAQGNLASEPELKFTASSKPFAKFRMAANKAKYDETSKEWETTGTAWLNVTVWQRSDGDSLPENLVNTLAKGMAVVVTGELETREYTDKDGAQRLSVDVNAESVSVDLRRATAVVSRNQARAQQPQQAAPQGSVPQHNTSAPPF